MSGIVLIVDDQLSVRETLEALLAPEGYELAFAANGVEALALAQELKPDVILLDVMMPVMDGFEVCRRLRADPLLGQVPIVMVTALDDQDSRLRGLGVGADDFVSKPFDRAELRARVKTIVRLNRYRRLLAERSRFEWVIQQSSEGYLMVDDADQLLYANTQARLYLNLPTDVSVPLAGKFLELARSRYHCEPAEAWAAWPADSAVPVPRYLLLPETQATRAFWLQVDVLDMSAVAPQTHKLIRLRDITAQMISRRDMWEFHAAISHKLRTPLVIALNSLELQAKHMADLQPEEAQQLSGMLLSSLERLRGAIGDILQYLSAPVLAQSGEGFMLSRLDKVVKEICAYVGIKSVTVVVPDELRQVVLGISERPLELSLWEILENALKFHPHRNPQVSVEIAAAAPERVSLRVRDDGLTLSPAQLARVWTPYYQGEKDFTGQAAGMGLGLPMVAALVWSVGGTCRMYNRDDGPGVVVELTLPTATA